MTALPLSLLFLSFPPQPSQDQEPSFPDTPAALAAALELKERELHLGQAAGLRIWSDDPEGFREADEPARRAWNLAQDWIGAAPLPEGTTAQVFILHGKERLQALLPPFAAECARRHLPAPGADFVQGVVHSGSGLWTNPPAVWINGQILHKDDLATRVVHDLGAIAARFAVSPFGQQPPEFWEEGFAAMLMRRALKKPAGLVSHQGAAQSFTVHGYGVFAAIGGAANDFSNYPGNWPGMLRQAAGKMRKEQPIDPKSMVDQLLLRSEAAWARTDYAYAWAVIEFLFDPCEPYGAAAADPKLKRGTTPLESSRRTVMRQVLAELRQDYAGLDAVAKAEQFRELVLERHGETPEQLHAAFMNWVETAMPKK